MNYSTSARRWSGLVVDACHVRTFLYHEQHAQRGRWTKTRRSMFWLRGQHTTPAPPGASSTSSLIPPPVVAYWLLATAMSVVAMVQVGAWTRLTRSGLSMTTWTPWGGLPPLTREQWEAEFHRYRQYPEWAQRQSMTLAEFQYIYYWEYGHRMLGRLIGGIYVIPWLYFTWRGYLGQKHPYNLQLRLGLLGGLGMLQGVVGWWMVKSGLGDDRRQDAREIRVQPTRLATHLFMAVTTYAGLVWTALDIVHANARAVVPGVVASSSASASTQSFPRSPLLSTDQIRSLSRLHARGMGLAGLTVLTMISGALVAGNDAGRAYNTFPTMDGDWVPTEVVAAYTSILWALPSALTTGSAATQSSSTGDQHHPFTHDTATVQWNHRVLATATATLALYTATFPGLRAVPSSTLQATHIPRALMGLGVATAGQYLLGVTTLLQYVPNGIAAAHQLGSIIVLTTVLFLVHSIRRILPQQLRKVVSEAKPYRRAV